MIQGAVVKKAAAKVATVILGSATMVAVDRIGTKVSTPEKEEELKQLAEKKAAIKKQKKETKQLLKNMEKVQKIQLKKAKLDAELAAIASENTIEPEQEWIPESQFVEDCE